MNLLKEWIKIYKMNKYFTILFFLLCGFKLVQAQNVYYEVQLEQIDVPELGGLQSYAYGTSENEWLIIGGRLDGLHRRQPWASFDEAGNNQNLMVVNPETQSIWKYPIQDLPSSIREQFSSTNMQFYQKDDILMLTGGYAYSPSKGDHITFPYLTIIKVSELIAQIKSGSIIPDNIIQIENENFRVTGGRLASIEDTYYLVGGHKFMGRYNPMGPNHGPGFIQEYTNEVRKFKWNEDKPSEVEFENFLHDERHLHRRDYNLLPMIYDGQYNLMAYSGVFKPTSDLPWLYPVQINENGMTPHESFSQYFNHYHCAGLPIYNEESESMNTIFFGGIAQFYMQGDVMVQDNDVPFVNTITSVLFNSEGEFEERRLSVTMPDLLGAGSEFILKDGVGLYDDGILDGDLIDDEFSHIGYIYGGIKSSLPNVFWINTGNESSATNTIFKVSIRRSETTMVMNIEDKEPSLLIYPNPAQNFVRLALELKKPENIEVSIFDSLGTEVHSVKYLKEHLNAGLNYLQLEKVNISFGAYLYRIKIGEKVINRRVIWSE